MDRGRRNTNRSQPPSDDFSDCFCFCAEDIENLPLSDMGPVVAIDNPFMEGNTRLIRNPYCMDIRQIGSFKDYLIGHYYQDFVSFLKFGIMDGRIGLVKTSCLIPNPDRIDVEDVTLRTIYFFKKSATEVYADYVMSANVIFYQRRSGGDGTGIRRDDVEMWYRLRTISGIDTDFQYFNELLWVNGYNKYEEPPGMPLDEYLIPYTKKVLLDSDGTSILHFYYEEALKKPTKIDGRELAKRMNLKIMFVRLSKRMVRGQVYFDNHTIDVMDDKGKKKQIIIPENTIVIDTDTCRDSNGNINEEKINDAIIHECIHFERHRLFYLGQRLYNEDLCCLSCTESGLKMGGTVDSVYKRMESGEIDDAIEAEIQAEGFTPIDRVEWQASHTTPCVLMPEYTARLKIDELYEKLKRKLSDKTDIEITERVVGELAHFFGVSKQTAKIRMIDLGYEEAQGVYNYVNGEYTKPYSFQKEKIGKGQKVTLSLEELLDLYEGNKEFRLVMDSGRFVYADGFVCLNDSKYIRYDQRSIHLTAYALCHADECCLIFNIKRRGRRNKYEVGTLYSEAPDGNAKLEFEKRYNKLTKDMDTSVTIYLPHVRGSQPQARDISLPKLYNGKAVVWRNPPRAICS